MSDLQLKHLESLWRRYQSRLKTEPDLSVTAFAEEHSDSKDDILKLFPMMLDLAEFANDPIGPPEQIGGYKVVRQIGIGGMGVVYEATSESLRERLAIKVVDPSLLVGQAVDQLEREARLAASLHHSNIVPVYEFGEYENNRFYTMRFIDGPNLSDVLHLEIDGGLDELSTKEQQALQVAELINENWDLQVNLIRQAASAIAYAHDKNILHRDVKPANLLIDDSLKIWVTDFGLAKLRVDDQRMSARSKVLGTPRYMAPEQIRGEADERSDIFGLGLTFYEMALMRRDAGNDRKRIWKGGLKPISQFNPRVPPALEQIIMKAVSLDPSGRHSSAHELIDELDRWRYSAPVAVMDLPESTTAPTEFEPAPIARSESETEFELAALTNDEPEEKRNGLWWKLPLASAILFAGFLTVRGWTAAGPNDQTKPTATPAEAELTAAVNQTTEETTSQQPDDSPNTIADVETVNVTRGPLTFRIAEGSVTIGSIEGLGSGKGEFQISGDDADLIAVDGEEEGAPRLVFRQLVDFERARDSDGDGRYEFKLERSSDDLLEEWPVLVDVENANESPKFDSRNFRDGQDTILVSESNAAFPVALQISDDRDSVYDRLHVEITGGADQHLIGMTSSGVMAFVRPVTVQEPRDADRSSDYEIEVSASDSTTAYFVRLVEMPNGKFKLERDQLARGAQLKTEPFLVDWPIRGDVIDIATADGKVFFHLHRDGEKTVALYRSVIRDDGSISTDLHHKDCELSQDVIAFATRDGRSFVHAVANPDDPNLVELHRSTLGADGRFVNSVVNRQIQLPSQIDGLSWLDGNRFQHLRPTGFGSTRFYFSFLTNDNFVNMPLHDEPQFNQEVRGQAAWVEQSADSITTVRTIAVKVVQ